MSVKKLFEKNKKGKSASKYLKKSSSTSVDPRIESAGHLSESIEREKYFIPPVDYSKPENFARYGSAEKYYTAAFDYIVDNFPYDGSSLEKTKFYNSLSPLEKYTMQHIYPKETGFVKFGVNYGTPSNVAGNPSGYYSSSLDFIQALGGPHSGTLYSSGSNKESNLKFGGLSGSTVEFFLKKDQLIPNDNSQSRKQVIFDLTNGGVSGSTDYGRLRIELTSSNQDRFLVTLISGTTGFVTQSVPTTGGLAIASGSFHHYAFVFNTSGSAPSIDFYMDGICHQTNITASGYGGHPLAGNVPSAGGVKSGSMGEIEGTFIASIGSLQAPVTGATGTTPDKGWGKLSASIDEFRFWKTARTGKEIGSNWFADVDGGADVDDIDFNLGVYYRFNEGSTGTSSIDKVYLDYAGRLSNATHVGYNSSNSRQTGSAINELNISDIFENASPVVRAGNLNFQNIKSNLALSGTQYDYRNTSYMVNTLPSWILEEDESIGGELRNLNQILGSYFDTLYNQITQLRQVKDLRYLSGTLTGSSNEFPHNDRILENYGLEIPELFANATVLERYFNRSEDKNFELTIENIKNTIYKNIYNNLSYIYKSKGNEKSIRNLVRCYGIDDNVIALNVYANEFSYTLEENYKQISSNKKYADFSGLTKATSSAATCYQFYDSSNPNSHGSITGSDGILASLGLTAQAEFIFPNRQSFDESNVTSVSQSFYVSSSLFGWHTPSSGTHVTDTGMHAQTWADENPVTAGVSDKGFQVYAVKTKAAYSEITDDPKKVKDVRFIVKDRFDNTIITSAVFQNVYDNQKWNLSLTISPDKYPFSGAIAGISPANTGALGSYKIALYGVNYDSGIKRNSFHEIQNLAYQTGSQSLALDKKFYLGAHRTNFTGALLTDSDVRASSLRVWSTILPTGTIDLHAREVDSHGTLHPFRQAYEFVSSSEGSYPDLFIPEIETLALNWDFSNVTGSDSTGRFIVADMSAGSLQGIVAADATITTTGNPGNNETFTLTDAAGLAVGFIFKTSVTTVDGTKDGDNVIIGVNGASGSPAAVGDRIRAAINASDLAMSATETAPGAMTLTQSGRGTTGNTTIDMSGVATTTATSFTGGRDSYESSYQGKLLSNINLRQHTGRGEFFLNSYDPVIKQYVEASQKQVPEYVASTDMISIEDSDVQVFQPTMRPSNFYYSLEKSMYQSISRKMLDMFASIDDFNNLIGDPVNTFRPNYKSMEKMREIFFRKVSNTPDLEKYIKYYKWIDSSIGQVVQQLFPASSKHSEELRTVVESHVLERNKHKYSYLGNRQEMLSLVDDGIESLVGGDLGYSNNSSSAQTIREERRKGLDKSVSLTSFSPTNQLAPQFKFLTPPLGNLEKDNTGFWRYSADINDPASPLSASNNINADRIKIRNAARSEALRAKTVNISGFYGQEKTDNRSLIQRESKAAKQNNVFNIITDNYESLENNEDLKKVFPSQKRKVPFRANAYNGADNSGDLIAPFSVYDVSGSEIVAGYITQLQTATTKNINITNFHEDIPASYHNGMPLQGPFTKQHVGGLIGRNVPALRKNILAQNVNRSEVFSTTVINQTSSVASIVLDSGISNPATELNDKTITLTLGGVSYSAAFKGAVNGSSTSKTIIGVADAFDADDAATNLVTSLNLAATADGLPLVASISLAGANVITVFGTNTGTRDNSTSFAGSAFTGGSPKATTSAFANGSSFSINLATHKTGDIPKGHYTRNNMAKSPVNIVNIKSSTGSLAAANNSDKGIQLIGNFDQNYEVVHGFGRENANIDFIFNNRFYTASNPSAFLTTAERREQGLSGSADYSAPRQRATKRIGKSIIASRFASPGGKEDSKQQFRDIATDQFSPNNALPFRNIFTRRVFNSQSMTFTGWGGFRNSDVIGILPAPTIMDPFMGTDNNQGPNALTELNQGSGSFAAIHKTQRNQTSRFQILANYPNHLPNVDGGGDPATDNGDEFRTYNTASKHDNDYVQRPIPAADRIKWFTFLTGANFTRNINQAGAGLKDQEVEWTLSGSKFPESITIIKTDYANTSSQDLTNNLLGSFSSNNSKRYDAISKINPQRTTSVIYNYDPFYSRIQPPAPWTQTRVGQTTIGSFHRRQNLYEIPPKSVIAAKVDGIKDASKEKEIFSSVVRSDIDRGFYSSVSLGFSPGNLVNRNIEFRHYKRFKEPPVTSRYKPLVHVIETPLGTPEDLNKEAVTVDIKYSYGNILQGFANRDLNKEIQGSRRYSLGQIKRPYEVILDYRRDGVEESISGINEIKSLVYEESIFPKEIYTYLSGTRARLSFTNQNFWRNDHVTGSQNISTVVAALLVGGKDVSEALTFENLKRNNRQSSRMKDNFITSQGTLMMKTMQLPFEKGAEDYEASDGDVLGSGSVWPLDSFMYSDYMLTALTGGDGAGEQRFATNMASTLPAGELMMVHYGRAFMGAAPPASGSSTTSDVWTSSSVNSAQYVYIQPCVFSGTFVSSGGTSRDIRVTASYPGCPALALPPWTAGTRRRFVDGINKGQIAPEGYPFYDDYDTWKKEIRAIAKDYAIVPEFRISENLEEYKQRGSVLSFVSSSLELTGASDSNFDTTNTEFLERYSTTDVMEYLNPFMQEGSYDLENNKHPRHLSLKSDAVLKLLPYDGFYPVLRTVQIAQLFSQSYGPHAVYGGESASHPARWRTLLRPFFAPGLLYNSIKGGIAVSHPVRRYLGKTAFNDEISQDSQYISVRIDVDGEGTADKSFEPLAGCLSGSQISDLSNLPGGRRRRREGPNGNYDFTISGVEKAFWADSIPFEGLLNPLDHIGQSKEALLTHDINVYLRHFVSASVGTNAAGADNLYRLAMSNFLAATPEFFLKKKKEGGFMTKIVAELPARNDSASPKGNAPTSDTDPRTVFVDKKKAYLMEIVIRKTDGFNMYNNPAAFGIPTATGTGDWNLGTAPTIDGRSFGNVPIGKSWPQHRGEFAPFTPPYYYGPSIARLTYFPDESKNVTLDEILNGSELYIEYVNEDGFHYNFSSGSFALPNGKIVHTTGSTDLIDFGANVAWFNRMDIDESVVIDNSYPTDFGAEFSPANKNRWVIMPKWECPVLDFPRHDQTSSISGPDFTGRYNFSSSVDMQLFSTSSATKGMWHQYGVMPDEGQGIYLYISDIDDKATEFRMANDDPTRNFSSSNSYRLMKVLKLPVFVKESKRDIESLAKLVGFSEKDIMPAGQFLPDKAKRLGELAGDGEKILSEAILAIPYYYDTDSQSVSFVNLQADANKLGPKIKEFRRVFSNYSLPPALRKALRGLLPPDYPNIPNFINPFGEDELDEVLTGTDLAKVPVVYLLEHKVSLSRQDLADIWQGIMPDVGRGAELSVSSIDHYMPGKATIAGKRPIFDEVLQKQIDLGIERDGFPRVDLLDTTPFPNKNGFTPDIRWLVFKVKKRGKTNYTSMILSEINGGDDKTSFSSIYGYLADGLPSAQKEELLKRKDEFTKGLYHSDILGQGRNTFNWPYDYFSLVEMTKLTAKVGFRPDLENAEVGEDAQETLRKKAASKIAKSLKLDPNMIGRQKNIGTPSSSTKASTPVEDVVIDQATATAVSDSVNIAGNITQAGFAAPPFAAPQVTLSQDALANVQINRSAIASNVAGQTSTLSNVSINRARVSSGTRFTGGGGGGFTGGGGGGFTGGGGGGGY